MGFIMEGLAAEDYDRSYSDRQLLARILGYFRPVRWAMVLVATLVVLNSLMDTVLPIVISRGIDLLAPGAAAGSAAEIGAAGLLTAWTGLGARDARIAGIVLLILASGALSWTFNFIRQWITARTVGDVVLQLREDAFEAVMARDMSFYDESSSGRIVSRVTSDTQDFATVVTLTLNLLSQVLLVLLIAGALFYVNTQLALLAMIIAPAVVATALGFRRIARRTTRDARRILATVNSTVQESVRGIGVAKAFRQEGAIYEEFGAVNRQTYDVNLRQGFVFSAIFPILGTIAGLGTVLIILYGGRLTLSQEVSPGEWYFFAQAIGIFWFPLTGIASFWSQFQQGLSASERVFALIDAEPRVVQKDDRPADGLAGKVAFRAVDFHYVPGEPVLRDFDLEIAAGETVALVGHTGAGKSSIVKLISRFYEFQDGTIEIDGTDIRDFDLPSYRRRLGIVPQTPFLFDGSVADNVRYGRPNATDEQVAAAARDIGGGDWLAALPLGLATQVGEGGNSLSMGQRQLVVLARVLLQDPTMVILDEATASVDPLTEAQIQEGLDVVLATRTAIIIAHRLSTIQGADRIIVLADGAIIEQGDHDSLIADAGHYAELYNAYFRHQSPDYVPGGGFVAVGEGG
jgi:ABC-type multidrug transport system fused ATPase/permease subunit